MMKAVLIFELVFLASCAATHQKKLRPNMQFDLQGHRGCRGLLPENTIPAMLHALDLGVTTLEMDAVITADSEVILSHEPFFNHEITTDADGHFIDERGEQQLNIYKMTYAETQKFDVGLKPHPRFPTQQKIAVHKPLLRDVIDSVETYIRNKKLPPVFYNIETKTTRATDGLFHPKPDIFVRLLMQVLSEKEIQERVIIQSFDVRTLQVVHTRHPEMKTALLVEEGDTQPFLQHLKTLGFNPTIYSPHYTLVDINLVSQCHAAGLKLIPWTVNTKKEGTALKKLGVDGFISDYPNLFAAPN